MQASISGHCLDLVVCCQPYLLALWTFLLSTCDKALTKHVLTNPIVLWVDWMYQGKGQPIRLAPPTYCNRCKWATPTNKWMIWTRWWWNAWWTVNKLNTCESTMRVLQVFKLVRAKRPKTFRGCSSWWFSAPILLNTHLSRFTVETKKTDGSKYAPTTICQLLCGLLGQVNPGCLNFLNKDFLHFYQGGRYRFVH